MNQDPYTQTNLVERRFGLHYHEDEHPWLTSQRTLRRLIGTLGIALPFLLIFFVWLTSGWFGTMESISHYYFTRAGTIFTLVVSLLAIFLLIYKGYDRRDFYISCQAALAAFTLVLLPTCNVKNVPAPGVVVAQLPESSLRANAHYFAAAIFLLSLAYMSIFLFTKGKTKPRPKRKIIKNRIFRICGVLMVIAVGLIFLHLFNLGIPPDIYNQYHLTFWLEVVAVVSFGISWMVKGDAVWGLKEPSRLELKREELAAH